VLCCESDTSEAERIEEDEEHEVEYDFPPTIVELLGGVKDFAEAEKFLKARLRGRYTGKSDWSAERVKAKKKPEVIAEAAKYAHVRFQRAERSG
jgi:hypothetical protein